jgi:tetratricopeptide (TPR) repeat protein
LLNEHPAPAELEGFVWNRLPSKRVGAVVAHLVRGCDSCRAVLVQHLSGLLGEGEPPEAVLSAQEDAAYDVALDRAFAAVFRKEREISEERKQEALSLLADPSLEGLPEVPAHLQGAPFFEALLERSWSLRHESPEQMVRLADWARLLSEQLEGGALGEGQVEDRQCRAWIELGNAYRVADDLERAEKALCRATELFLRGSRDEVLAARLFDVQASLYGDGRRFDLAATALDMVFAIYRRRGDKHLAGRALISKGMYLGYQGESEEAVHLIEDGLELVDESRDPRLVFLAIHNQAGLLVDCGRFRDARIALFNLKSRGIDPGGRVNELKVRWVDGHINAGLGELDRAELALREVREGFEAMDLGYKAALAGLELGAVLLRQGRLDDSVREVLGAADVFIALGISREAGASLLLLRSAFERRVGDAALLDYVIQLLRGLEGSPQDTEPEQD